MFKKMHYILDYYTLLFDENYINFRKVEKL